MSLFSTEFDGYKHKVIKIFGIKFKKKLSGKELAKIHAKKGNQFILHKENGDIEEFPEIPGLKVQFYGTNCKVELWEPVNFKQHKTSQSSWHLYGDNNSIEIKSSKHAINNLFIASLGNIFGLSTHNNKIFIDEDFSCEEIAFHFLFTNNCIVKIGKNCMFSSKITLFTGDGHTLYNLDNPQNVNTTNFGITIGNHVWIGHDVKILKDVIIPDNTVIGTSSLVNKQFSKPNTVIAGIPAKVVKENISWDRRRVEEYIADMNKKNEDEAKKTAAK